MKLHTNYYKNSNKINITNNNIGNSRHDIIIYNYSVLRVTPDVTGKKGKGGIKCTIYFKIKLQDISSQDISFAIDILNYSEGEISNTRQPTKQIKEIFNKNLNKIFEGNDMLIRTNQNFKIVKIELSDNLYNCNKPYEINPMDLSIIRSENTTEKTPLLTNYSNTLSSKVFNNFFDTEYNRQGMYSSYKNKIESSFKNIVTKINLDNIKKRSKNNIDYLEKKKKALQKRAISAKLKLLIENNRGKLIENNRGKKNNLKQLINSLNSYTNDTEIELTNENILKQRLRNIKTFIAHPHNASTSNVVSINESSNQQRKKNEFLKLKAEKRKNSKLSQLLHGKLR
jgi:hypothetical protein